MTDAISEVMEQGEGGRNWNKGRVARWVGASVLSAVGIFSFARTGVENPVPTGTGLTALGIAGLVLSGAKDEQGMSIKKANFGKKIVRGISGAAAILGVSFLTNAAINSRSSNETSKPPLGATTTVPGAAAPAVTHGACEVMTTLDPNVASLDAQKVQVWLGSPQTVVPGYTGDAGLGLYKDDFDGKFRKHSQEALHTWEIQAGVPEGDWDSVCQYTPFGDGLVNTPNFGNLFTTPTQG